MKSRISPKSAKPSVFGAEGSACLPKLPNLPFLELRSQTQIPSLPSLPFSERTQSNTPLFSFIDRVLMSKKDEIKVEM